MANYHNSDLKKSNTAIAKNPVILSRRKLRNSKNPTIQELVKNNFIHSKDKTLAKGVKVIMSDAHRGLYVNGINLSHLLEEQALTAEILPGSKEVNAEEKLKESCEKLLGKKCTKDFLSTYNQEPNYLAGHILQLPFLERMEQLSISLSSSGFEQRYHNIYVKRKYKILPVLCLETVVEKIQLTNGQIFPGKLKITSECRPTKNNKKGKDFVLTRVECSNRALADLFLEEVIFKNDKEITAKLDEAHIAENRANTNRFSIKNIASQIKQTLLKNFQGLKDFVKKTPTTQKTQTAEQQHQIPTVKLSDTPVNAAKKFTIRPKTRRKTENQHLLNASLKEQVTKKTKFNPLRKLLLARKKAQRLSKRVERQTENQWSINLTEQPRSLVVNQPYGQSFESIKEADCSKKMLRFIAERISALSSLLTNAENNLLDEIVKIIKAWENKPDLSLKQVKSLVINAALENNKSPSKTSSFLVLFYRQKCPSNRVLPLKHLSQILIQARDDEEFPLTHRKNGKLGEMLVKVWQQIEQAEAKLANQQVGNLPTQAPRTKVGS